MKNTTKQKHGAAYDLVKLVYDESPGRSWSRLNDALREAMIAAITAHLSFNPDDFATIREHTNAHRWMGEGVERYYTMACELGHTPACISYERWADRPAALWAENVKTPTRLHVGSRFTWEGCSVTITSMKHEHFIACSYADDPYTDELTIGSPSYIHGDKRIIEAFKHVEGGGLLLRCGPEIKGHEDRKPERIFKIKYEDLARARKSYDYTRKHYLKEIAATESSEQIEEVKIRIGQAGRDAFRHFDIEDIRNAIGEQEKAITEGMTEKQRAADKERAAAQLVKWIAGEDVPSVFGVVKLRIKGPYVETSTGQSVTVESAKVLLPWAMRYRNKPYFLKAPKQLDTFEVREFTANGVQVGCTLIPWSEIERIKPELMKK